MITILDYGVGNIKSLLNMYEYLGIEAVSSNSADVIADAEGIILPGVGSFDKAMNALQQLSIINGLEYAALERKVPVLGICLGMQIMARRSAEGKMSGLCWLDADVCRITTPESSGLKIPHMGWNEVLATRDSQLFERANKSERFYFVHSYHMVCDDLKDVLATTEYGEKICCAINKENIWGVQFHPEKSHRYGMNLLKSFAAMTQYKAAK